MREEVRGPANWGAPTAATVCYALQNVPTPERTCTRVPGRVEGGVERAPALAGGDVAAWRLPDHSFVFRTDTPQPPPHTAPTTTTTTTIPAQPVPTRSARTGTWDGPAPKLPGAAARAASATRVVPPPPLPSVRLPGGQVVPHTGIKVTFSTTAATLAAALAAGVTAVDVSCETNADAAAALRALPPADRAALVVTVTLPLDADPVPALAAVLDGAGLSDRGADVVLLPGPPPPRKAAEIWTTAAPALLATGRAAAVGMSDWGLADIEAALEAAAAPGAGVPRPTLARVELHPLLPQRKLVGVCRRKGVAIVAGGVLGAGQLLTHEGVVAAAGAAGKTPAEVS